MVTRSKDKLRLPRVTRNWGKQGMCYLAIDDWKWNSFNKDIRSFISIKLFKCKL
jgi:hypothetical protein